MKRECRVAKMCVCVFTVIFIDQTTLPSNAMHIEKTKKKTESLHPIKIMVKSLVYFLLAFFL